MVQVVSHGPQSFCVVLRVPNRRVAAITDNSSDALAAAPFALRATGVIMIYGPVFLTFARVVRFARLTDKSLFGKHQVKQFWGQVVIAKSLFAVSELLFFWGLLRLVARSVFGLFPRIGLSPFPLVGCMTIGVIMITLKHVMLVTLATSVNLGLFAIWVCALCWMYPPVPTFPAAPPVGVVNGVELFATLQTIKHFQVVAIPATSDSVGVPRFANSVIVHSAPPATLNGFRTSIFFALNYGPRFTPLLVVMLFTQTLGDNLSIGTAIFAALCVTISHVSNLLGLLARAGTVRCGARLTY